MCAKSPSAASGRHYAVAEGATRQPTNLSNATGYSFRLDARPIPWCRAGGYLFRGIVAEAWERTPGGERPGGTGYPDPVPEGLLEHVEDWHRRCR